jgi:hypothetical protein
MKRNTLTTAVLAGLTGVAGMASVANAVNVNPDGLGQVLLYPYYSARGGNDTLISIVNTTDRAKAVKIRFIEALNSREVLDFNIYMSEFDVWAAGITEEGDGAKVIFSDTTCTAPYILEEFGGQQEFLTLEFDDGGPTGADRTKSGYIEVIEMGELAEGSAAETAATHTAAGVPPVSGVTASQGVCGLFQERWIDASLANGNGIWLANAQQDIDPPAGGLFGSGSLINVDAGTMVTYNATAIDGFFDNTIGQHTNPGDLFPSLSDGNVETSNVFVNGTVSTVTWDNSIGAINHALTFETLMNEYSVDDGLAANSEWVVTFPTKRFHVDGVSPPVGPFTESWLTTDPDSCDELDLKVWDREEQTPGPGTGGVVVSPSEDPEVPTFELCREVNVIRFASDDSVPAMAEITGEPSAATTVNPAWGYVNFGVPYQNGWARFDFGSKTSDIGGTDESGAPVEITGLPVIGFWANTYTNGNIADGVLSNYGGAFNHRGSRSLPQSAATEG